MSGAWTVFRREMRSYFVSPVAYALLVAFLVLSGWYFHALVERFMELAATVTQQAEMLQQPPPVLNINLGVIRSWMGFASELLLFLTPIVTMKLLAEERGTGRLDLLLSAPVTDRGLVIGKFAAGWSLSLFFFLPTLLYAAILFLYGNPQLGPILAGYLGLGLLSAALVSLGLLISALTNSQAVAAAGGFGAALMLWIVGMLAQGQSSKWSSLLSSVSLLDQFSDFASGVIATKHIVYFLTFTLFCLYLTLRVVESQRWSG